MKNNLEKNTSFQQDVFPRVAHHGHKNSYASKTEGAEKGSKLFEPALLPKKCMMNCSVFRTGLPAFHHLLTGWLPCNCCLMHLLKFPSCQRQGIPPHPIGASSGSNGISHQQRHLVAGTNNQQNQGSYSKLENGVLMICSQMWALTWKFTAEKVWRNSCWTWI